MRLQLLALLIPLFSLYVYGVNADPSSSGGNALYPPGLQPLINRANVLLSSGQYNDAAKAYSEAIEQSPLDYLLYYKRATAYLSMSRHAAALADFDQVLSLTSNTFEKAHLMKARIHAKEGNFAEARDSLKEYTTKNKNDPAAQEILISVTEAELAAKKASQAMRAQLWTACEEAASTALLTASHSVGLRQQRADCALAAGNIESAAGDLTRLTHITTPSTSLLMKLFRLTYFLFPYSSSSDQSPALSTLKQCLHYDPDSSQCLPAHRLVKSFDKNFRNLEQHLAAEDWRAVVKLLFGSGPSDNGFMQTFDDALEKHMTRAALDLPSFIPLPDAKHISSRREVLLRAACKAYFKLGQPKKGEQWCDALLGMQGMQSDADGLLGKGEALLAKEEWEEAVRVLEKAFEASGRSSREIHTRLQRAQKLLKQSRQKDYYKVLDVPRDADTQAIKKAFRKAAIKAHPDKGGSEAKMAAVNEAYEVLSNPELRQRYDNGDDPNDPTSAQGGHPFHGGGAQHFAQFFQQGFGGGGFGGSGFQFHFPGGRGH